MIERAVSGVSADELCVGLHLGCGRTAVHGWKFWYSGRDRDPRLWPLDKYIDLAHRMTASRPKIRFIITGSSNETFLARRFVAAVPNTINLVGKTSIPLVSALMTRLRLFITQDTGILHVACATDVPLIGLFGPSNVATTGPYPIRSRHKIIQRPAMIDISSAEVCAAALDMLVESDGRGAERIHFSAKPRSALDTCSGLAAS